MKRILLAGAALAVMTTAPMAADYAAPADVDVWSGYFVGIQGGYAFKDVETLVDGADDDFESDDFVIGAYYGRNWQSGDWVFGLDSSISYIGLDEDEIAGNVNLELEANLLGLSRLKVGYAVDNTLFFVAGGVASTYFSAEDTATDDDDDDFALGFTVGAGVEHKFSDSWSARIEYAYFNIESDDMTVNADDIELEVEGHIVRGGIAYHF
ncbi:porin [Terrihabitans soli]|uniref:Porin n=1 Tax=Terrihabitans soli TaxID=708113 RepID=A0A6S6QTV5_9HYPH|nr:outer membrane beta-barrel protein [Terrihabitans soli]BCJ91377.1 porin [Terrihabitans soli]